MAKTTEVAARLDLYLESVSAEIDFLPEMAELWPTESLENRLNFALEWDNLMDQLQVLHRADLEGEFSTQQRERYRTLVERIQATLPIIERLELEPPAATLVDSSANLRRQ